ncbi:MAG: B12-binding domain-containing radical SAM protein [Planctomycetes bacterium]|nr:B12-binding domain-containing radical SAM protein [Planctomycetota bacterium]
MELPSRPKNDRYTPPGRYQELARRLRGNADVADIPSLVCYAFDYRTRLGPFLFADKRLLTAGPRAVAAALVDAGFVNTRIVLRQWNPNFRASEARLDGKVPELLLVSSMQIHSASAYEMIRDAHRLGHDRPLILAGGAKAIYEPWDFFGADEARKCSADVAVTGEEFVILELLDRLLEFRAGGEHLRKTFHRLRRSGLLDDIPGMVFREGDEKEPLGRLINTGIQRMVQNLDELPHPVVSLGLLEPPHNRSRLSAKPLRVDKIYKHAGMISLVTTHGCKFHCPYCPIPAYNQFTFRYKSPDRLRDEIQVLAEKTGVHAFFGTDDNFFNSRETVNDIFSSMAKGKVHGKPFRDSIFFGTEATEFDVFKNQDLLPLCREGGLRAIWFGIEDMTAELVKKGQSPEKTKTLFQILTKMGICPMPMMMHHDGQPLASRGNLYGLINQVNFLRKSGSVSVQVTILTPSVGSKGYEETFKTGMVIDNANGQKVEDYQFDGNHLIATTDAKPWRKQINIFIGYASFYNPINFVRAIARWNDPLWSYRVLYQVYGMAGLVKSVATGWGWIKNLWRGPIQKMADVPRRRLEMIPPPVTPEQVARMQLAQSV